MCSAKRMPWTAVAEPHPTGLCRTIAAAMCVGKGWCSPEKLSVAACARSASCRIGEASNPGPRRGGVLRGGSLFQVNLLSATTAALEARLLQEVRVINALQRSSFPSHSFWLLVSLTMLMFACNLGVLWRTCGIFCLLPRDGVKRCGLTCLLPGALCRNGSPFMWLIIESPSLKS